MSYCRFQPIRNLMKACKGRNTRKHGAKTAWLPRFSPLSPRAVGPCVGRPFCSVCSHQCRSPVPVHLVSALLMVSSNDIPSLPPLDVIVFGLCVDTGPKSEEKCSRATFGTPVSSFVERPLLRLVLNCVSGWTFERLCFRKFLPWRS